MSTPGIGDPYWYEWYVGLSNIIDMLNPDNNISYVILQDEKYDVIDDVVVGHNSGKEEHCYQVKHEVGDIKSSNLTFSKLVKKTQKKPSLLNAIAKGWYEANISDDLVKTVRIPILYTNREYGSYKQKRTFDGTEYIAYNLKDFYEKLKQKIIKVNSIEEIIFEDENLQNQWLEFSDSIKIPEEDMFSFLKTFVISEDSPNLQELEKIMKEKLKIYFKCTDGVANNLFKNLVYELRKWVTTIRKYEKIQIEDVFNALSIGEDILRGNHDLYPPSPFFKSREEFCEDIIKKLAISKYPVIFFEGEPGSGKTSVASYMYKIKQIFSIRFYAFRPISPEMRIYENDSGLCSIRSFWSDLLIQIREKFNKELFQYQVPIINELCSDIQLKREVLRLLECLYKRDSKKVYVCIDGIDHAARSENTTTFLEDLPFPDEIPEGVCFVIFGQPSDMYEKYPEWLKYDNNLVKKYLIPKLTEDDLTQLFENIEISWMDTENISLKEVVRATMQKTNGNNLSVVFAVEEAKGCKNAKEYFKVLDDKHANGDVCKYYSYLWNYAKEMIRRQGINLSFPDVVIASAIVLMNGQIDTNLVSKALSKKGLTTSDWNYMMNLLYPLILPIDDNKYAIFHNDFRVYLTSIFNGKNSKYQEVAAEIADYLIVSDDILSRAYNTIPLLRCAKKNERIAEVFSTKFVIEYLAERLPFQTLIEYSKLAIESAISIRNWSLFYSVGLAINTMQQHIKYYEYYDREYISREMYENVKRPFLEEWKSSEITFDNLHAFKNAIKIAKMLLKYDYIDGKARASKILKLWFKNFNPCEFVNKLKNDKTSLSNVWDTKLLESIFSEWGSLQGSLNLNKFTVGREYKDLSSEEVNALITFNDSYLNYYFEKGINEKFFEVLNEGGYSYSTIEEKLELILLSSSTIDLSNIYMKICSQGNEKIRILGLLGLMISQNISIKIKDEEINKFNIESREYISEDLVYELCIFAIAYSIRYLNKDISIISTDFKVYYKEIKESKEKKYLSKMILLSIIIGKLISSEINNKNINIELLFENTIDILIKEKNNIREFEFNKTFYYLIKICLAYNKNINKSTLGKSMRKILFMHPFYSYYKCSILDYFLSEKRLDIIKEYIDTVYNDNFYKIENYSDIHKHFRKYGIVTNKELMLQVDMKLKWDVVNYISHKEYALDEPLYWLDELMKINPDEWKTRGMMLLKQSDLADNFGNKMGYNIYESLQCASIKNSYSEHWKFMCINKNYYDLELIYDSLFEYIKKSQTYRELKNIWYFSIGILSWYNNDDRIGIKSVYNSIKERLLELDCDGGEIIEPSFSLYRFIIQENSSDKKDLRSSDSSFELDRKKIKQYMGKMNIQEIIELLKRTEIDNYKKWEYLFYAITIIDKRGELDSSIALQLKKIFEEFSEDIIWNHYSDITKTIHTIVNVLGEEVIWDFAKLLLYINNDDSGYLLNVLKENIYFLLKEKAIIKDACFLQSMFDMSLNTNREWCTGAGHIYSIEDNIEVEKCELSIPTKFEELALNVLLVQCGSKNIHRCEIALLGIENLLRNNRELNDYLVSMWGSLSKLQKNVLYILFERWCQENNRINKYIQLIQKDYDNTNEADIKEQLYYIIKNYYMNNSQENTEIDFDNRKSIAYILPNSLDIYENFIMKKEGEIVSIKSESILNRIKGITGDLCNDLKGWLMKNYILNERVDRTIPSRDIDTVLSETKYDIEFMKIIYGEIAKGRWLYVDNVNIAQALLNSDDAWVLTKPPCPPINEAIWNIEKILEESINNNDILKAKKALKEITFDGINESQIVLGAEIYFPVGHTKSYLYTLTQKIYRKLDFSFSNGIPYSLTDTSLLRYENNHYLPPRQENVLYATEHIGGLSGFYNGNTKISPSYWIKDLLRWKPQKNNPLVWYDNNNKITMKNERFAYPVREAMRELYVRQPIMSRWVCNKRDFEEFLKSSDLKMIEYEEFNKGEY